MLLHAQITDRGGLGSLVETFLSWFGLFVPVLLAGALWRRWSRCRSPRLTASSATSGPHSRFGSAPFRTDAVLIVDGTAPALDNVAVVSATGGEVCTLMYAR